MYEEKKKSEKNFLEIKFESIGNSLFIYSISFWFLKNFFNQLLYMQILFENWIKNTKNGRLDKYYSIDRYFRLC